MTVLKVCPEGTWFEVSGEARVRLSHRRGALRRILARLSSCDDVSTEDLVAAGWPGEEITAEVGKNRIHVAIWTLRNLGLRDMILARPGGYSINPAVGVEIEPEDRADAGA